MPGQYRNGQYRNGLMNRRQALRLAATSAIAPYCFSAPTASAIPPMPGRFPGRVVAIEDAKAIVGGKFQDATINVMMREGMLRLTGEKDLKKAWQTLFQPGDVVGIKWNPNGRDELVSSRPVLDGLLYGLDLAGVRMTDVIIYERYADILERVSGWFPRWLKRQSASPTLDR